MRLLALMLGIALAAGASAGADAATYDFTFESANYDIGGQITTDGSLITSISGNVTGLLNAPIGGLDGQYNIYFTSYNQVSFVAPPYVTNAGVLFDAGGYFFNIYSIANGSTFNYYLSSTQFGGDYYNNPLFNPGDLILKGSVAVTPLPSTWVMMIGGLLVFAMVGFRRREPAGAYCPVPA